MVAHGSRSGRRPAEPERLLVHVLAHYGVDLAEGRWGNAMVQCPVHGERRASMSVSVEKGLFNCFACDARGDAVKLVQLMETCGRVEAEERTRKILDAAGIEMKTTTARTGGSRARKSGKRWVPPGRRSA